MGSAPIWAQLIERFGWVEKLGALGYDERVKLTPGVRIKALRACRLDGRHQRPHRLLRGSVLPSVPSENGVSR